MGLLSAIGKQLQHPRGLFGKALFRWMTRTTIAHARWTADLMDVRPDDHVLEVGFGNGTNIGLLARRRPRATLQEPKSQRRRSRWRRRQTPKPFRKAE